MADGPEGEVWRGKDGRDWRIGSAEEVRWIQETPVGKSVADAIPPVFEAYATLELPGSGNGEALDFTTSEAHDAAVVEVLRSQGELQPWWLGFLDYTSSADLVFNDAPRVKLYAGWDYVVVEAGPKQAATWRQDWKGALPDLIFPADRSWLFTTLWDDDWTCIGGPRGLIDAFLADPVLRERSREVDPRMTMKEATPPGHVAF